LVNGRYQRRVSTLPLKMQWGDWKRGSGKCDTVKNARLEYAGVEKSGADRRGGKCRSWVALWEAERRLFRQTALNYLLKIISDWIKCDSRRNWSRVYWALSNLCMHILMFLPFIRLTVRFFARLIGKPLEIRPTSDWLSCLNLLSGHDGEMQNLQTNSDAELWHADEGLHGRFQQRCSFWPDCRVRKVSMDR